MSPQYLKKEIKIFGWSMALDRFIHRRHLPIFGYFVLALACAFAIGSNRDYYKKANHNLATSTKIVLVATCAQNNQLRGSLREILHQSEVAEQVSFKKHLITKEQLDLGNNALKFDLSKLTDVDCGTAYKSVK